MGPKVRGYLEHVGVLGRPVWQGEAGREEQKYGSSSIMVPDHIGTGRSLVFPLSLMGNYRRILKRKTSWSKRFFWLLYWEHSLQEDKVKIDTSEKLLKSSRRKMIMVWTWVFLVEVGRKKCLIWGLKLEFPKFADGWERWGVRDSANVFGLRTCKNWVCHLLSWGNERVRREGLRRSIRSSINFSHVKYEIPIYYSPWGMSSKVGGSIHESGLKKQDQS